MSTTEPMKKSALLPWPGRLVARLGTIVAFTLSALLNRRGRGYGNRLEDASDHMLKDLGADRIPHWQEERHRRLADARRDAWLLLMGTHGR
ncbi:hypothetical protein NAC44_06490 [Allorhizobium sp. BGMRC 0089]|uniref:hypothetical protein n=1 Tax=Allorhizobium sonneratiae TaxID=2934936 RepID=UPI0020344632|nr:hypothetical protein [Allorhizobium sonneratiae]MCM2291976.1 hypothetical protein [Allorhizobium sonneratiae]